MNKIALFIILITSLTGTAQDLPKVTFGRIERIENFKTELVEPRNIDIWLPENFDQSKHYTVVYMHDGQMLFDATSTWNKQEWAVDETAGELIQSEKTMPFIVVGTWNGGKTRFTDYFPEKAFESLSESFQDSLMFGGICNLNAVCYFTSFFSESDF